MKLATQNEQNTIENTRTRHKLSPSILVRNPGFFNPYFFGLKCSQKKKKDKHYMTEMKGPIYFACRNLAATPSNKMFTGRLCRKNTWILGGKASFITFFSLNMQKYFSCHLEPFYRLLMMGDLIERRQPFTFRTDKRMGTRPKHVSFAASQGTDFYCLL